MVSCVPIHQKFHVTVLWMILRYKWPHRMNCNTLGVLFKHFLSMSGYKCPKIVGETMLRKINLESWSFHLIVWSKVTVWVPFTSWYNAEFWNSRDGKKQLLDIGSEVSTEEIIMCQNRILFLKEKWIEAGQLRGKSLHCAHETLSSNLQRKQKTPQRRLTLKWPKMTEDTECRPKKKKSKNVLR